MLVSNVLFKALFSFPNLCSKFWKMLKKNKDIVSLSSLVVIIFVSFLLGFVNWHNMIFFNAMDKDAFRKRQPKMYNTIKTDCDDSSSDKVDEISDIFPDSLTLHHYPIFPILPPLLVEIIMSKIRNLKTWYWH